MTFPDWILRGGFERLVLWAVDAAGAPTGDTLSCGVVAPVAFAEAGERRTLDDGTLQDLTRLHAVAPALSLWPDVLTLRRWRAAGHRVRAVLVAKGRGHHVLWDQAVPILLRPFSEDASGDRLTLHTEVFDAAVDEAPDLLGTDLDGTWASPSTRVLPAPGLTVYASIPGATVDPDVTIEALDFAGAVLATSTTAPLVRFTLPASTFSVRVTATTRPALYTRLLREAPTLLVDDDGFLLTADDGTPLAF